MEETRNAPFINVEDRFSRLPDNLIHHILSFIDTKYAVQTSLLSKRWIDTWKSLPFLNFDRNSFSEENTERFIEFVYMVFMFRDDETSIQKFSVSWEGSPSDNTMIMNVNRWSLFAVKRDVQEITIVIDPCQNSAYAIPHRLLNCKSLRKLEITVLDSDNDIHLDTFLPTSMNLPQLKVIILQGLSVSDIELSKTLFSSCPVLESLTILNCDIQTDNRGNFIVDSVSLKTFKYGCWLKNTMPNIIKLCTPNLELFTLRSFLSQDYSLEDSSALLSTVGFHMYLEETEEAENAETYSKLPSTEKALYAKRMMKFIEAVYAVKEMKVSSGFLAVLSQAPDLLDCQLPHLCNLYQLWMVMWPTKCCLRSIAYLLKISPHVTQLFLESKKSNFGDDWEAGLSSPGMLSHLKYVQIDDVEGCDAEFKILSFLLRNAKVLEEVVVYFRASVSSRDKVRQVQQFKDKLRVVPTPSSSIQLVFKT